MVKDLRIGGKNNRAAEDSRSEKRSEVRREKENRNSLRGREREAQKKRERLRGERRREAEVDRSRRRGKGELKEEVEEDKKGGERKEEGSRWQDRVYASGLRRGAASQRDFLPIPSRRGPLGLTRAEI